jgi:hypothetical protein
MNVDLHDFVKSFVYRDIKKLYLSFLYLVEDLNKNGKISEEDFQRLRKRILDHGNDCYRNIADQLNNFDIKFTHKI